MEFKFKEKKYSHLDYKRKPNIIERKIKDPEWVSHHGFLPLVHYKMKIRKRTGKHSYPRIKERDIYYASHTDSYIYQWYANILSQKYEIYVNKNQYSECATAYRSLDHKCNIDFAKEAFDLIKTQKNSFVFVSDFHFFFDTLDHKILKEKIKKILDVTELPADQYSIFKNITKFCYFDLDDIALIRNTTRKKLQRGKDVPKILLEHNEMRLYKQTFLRKNKEKGIPQGSPISAVYANIYMIDFDMVISDYVKKNNGYYRRYSDDIFCVLPYEKQEEFCELFAQQVNQNKLELSTDKTRRFQIVDGKINRVIIKKNESQLTKKAIEYLGFVFDGNHVLLKDATLNRFYTKLNNRLYLIKNLFQKKGKIIGIKELYKRYSHLGDADRRNLEKLRGDNTLSVKHRNFFSYVYAAADIMEEKQIRHQVSKHWKHIQKFLVELEQQ